MTLRDSIIANHEKDTKIIFYKIQSHTSDLLSKLLYRYSIQKDELLKKHQTVRDYIAAHESHPLEINLAKIQALINKDTPNNPYNIYISDKNLVIRNTTYKKDMGFDLSFAKKEFEEHFEKNIIGICSPLFEKSSKQFLSYSDSYLDANKSGVLQVGYT